jgi:hypothetical protein
MQGPDCGLPLIHAFILSACGARNDRFMNFAVAKQ